MKALDRGQTPYVATPDTTDEVGFVQVDADGVARDARSTFAGIAGAVAATVAVDPSLSSRFASGEYDVRDYGAVLDGTTDDSGALIDALAAMRAAGSGYVFVRNGTMGLASTVKIGSGARILWDDVRIESSVANGPALWITASTVEMAGRLTIDCNAATASTGLRVQGTTDFGASGSCTHCDLSGLDLTVLAATERSFDISSNPAVGNTILNRFGKLRSYQGTGVGLELRTTSGTAGFTNANDFAFVSIQSHTSGTPLRVDAADGNHFNFLEIENCTGSGIFAIDLVRAVGFYMDGGWLEGNTGNIRIADANDVLSVYIATNVDSLLTSADPKFSHTFSGNRAVEIKTGTVARNYLARSTRMQVGVDGTAANDQSVRGLAVSGGMECYRYSAGSPGFYFKGQVVGMSYYFDDGTTTLLDMNGTRAFFSGNVNMNGNMLINNASPKIEMTNLGPQILAGSGTPEGVKTAPIGSIYLRSNGGANTTLYVKESGVGNTGWIAK